MCLHTNNYQCLTLTVVKKKTTATNLCIQPKVLDIKTIPHFKVVQIAISKILCFMV